MIENKPLVSVCCITYKHKPYIRDTIEGFLMQKTTFPIEIIIHDDASTDGTADIIREYEQKYPEIIKPIYQKENQWSKGIRPSPTYVWPKAHGKYIALCEGDDYWTDPYKLQKQVDFLEGNPEYSLCFHDAIVLWEDKSQPPKYFCSKDQKETSTIEDVIEKWFIPSASMVFRKDAIMPLPEWFANIYNGDWALQLLLADKGKIKYLNEVMSVYRKNMGALSAGIGRNNIYVNTEKIKLLNYFNEYSNFKYSKLINKVIIKFEKEIKTLILNRKMPFLKYFNINVWIRKTIFLLNEILYKNKI